MRQRILLAMLGAVTAAALVPGAGVAAAGSVLRPVIDCADLVRDFDIPGAATRVTEAKVVPAGAEPAHCDVRGVIEPAVRFQLRLPVDGYAGNYLQYGCGGLCGVIFPTPFPDCGREAGDFAVAATDDGHVGRGGGFEPVGDGQWAADDRAARDDYFFRAPHVLSVAAKRIIAAFYGSPPRHAYFSGCSNGGREALLLAQRYPTDFDGIIAGAPANYFGPLLGVYLTWIARSNIGADGSPILTAAKLPVLHDAVLAACDGLDGLVDGQLEEPRLCRFDPGAVRCPGADAPGCLTAAQVAVARKLYAGPTDARGNRLYPGSEPFGSELAWNAWIIPAPELGPDSFAGVLADNYLRYVGYPIGSPHSSLADFRFTTAELHRLTAEGFKANALGLDLRPFRRAGGKLIMWHGWADSAIPPASTLDYHARLVAHNGGPRATAEFARLFMIPDIQHCGGGTRLTSFDPIRELVAWVEHGTAPDRIIATGLDEAGNITRTRPVFPYPLQARYDGTGSIDDAANFVPARPQTPQRDTIPWPGAYLHHIPGPTAR
ncbi:MAG TPA: tannase/feruloyl esterase family alpha/beta hydrolase [Actinophytocola sp.]|uniref:tannase/feruloyl esterase family alpha/beta hydrolase n=1 Tax=Actinophytocola sp. TaxID=1872138 RepID=UPI002DDD2FC5|nr:tannase/feruloyl esterase family alpha/beta hydrolase [Actinophytocola sp.]HEV2783779.1 tannase/feruloyl esterase family alpha/beta hydrolase [Actinophytocola sp.]